MRPKARRRDRPDVPAHLLDPGGRVPVDPARSRALLDYLAEADPAQRWHDPIALLTAVLGEPLDEVLRPAPTPPS